MQKIAINLKYMPDTDVCMLQRLVSRRARAKPFTERFGHQYFAVCLSLLRKYQHLMSLDQGIELWEDAVLIDNQEP